MVDNSFPSIKLVEVLNKHHKPGFTNGDIIFINFFTGIFMEEYIEEDLNILYIHELIHTIDMDLPEKSVLFATEKVLNNLRKP
jgi:hypothetical protein